MRSSRLLSILLRLQLRGRVTAAELAREFEVAVRTVYRDLDALSAAGVPLRADRGRGGGIVLPPGWRTELTGLTALEARSVPLAGLAGAARDLGLAGEAADVQLKLLASLPPDAAADAGRIAERFHVDPLPWYHRAEPLPLLPALAGAVWQGLRVRIGYESWSGAVERTLSPLGLVLKGGLWYLAASAGGRGAAAGPRTYRVSGIQRLRVLKLPARRPAGFVLAAHWPVSVADFEARLMQGRATVLISDEGLRILRSVLPAAADEALRTQRKAARPGWVQAEIPTEAEAYAARQLLRLGTEVEVLAPPALRAALAREAAAVARAHRGPALRSAPGSPA
ncbi:helix-turn-helix transcriptional regulator [Rubrivivax rivuli]|uniref:WYL domain-containing protein n=1 Tax=Rubrivivax rivuli TaxID=1862385 RepID=A0A437RCL7_9BURK|nr:WYL domain-containing protein [Rubrivivax rivuli]RVU44531.1 WYL domain-containing protein [Rubrivivax rivuli]